MKKTRSWIAGGALLVAVSVWGALTSDAKQEVVRIGYFPNLTHAQALIGDTSGAFQKAFGDTKIDFKLFNAGPSVIEALFAGKMDIAYIGPSPAINGYVKSQGDALRVIAGSASGGAALVVRQDAGIVKPEDFKGKKIASPQLGNTQDVALRSWIQKQGFKTKENGGDVRVLPLANADQVTLFMKKEIDGAWTVEPWVSILEQTADGKVFLEERSLWPGGRYATTLVIANKKFLEANPKAVKNFLAVHDQLIDWIKAHPDQAKTLLGEALEKKTGKAIPRAVLDSAFKRLDFEVWPPETAILTQARAAFEAGYLKKSPDLTNLVDTKLLEEVLAAKALAPTVAQGIIETADQK